MMNWLMARLNRFSEAYEAIDLRLNVTEKLMDVAHGEADIGVRCGKGDWPGVDKTWLMDEEAVLVCSPRLVPPEKIGCAEWLCQQKLIHDDTPHPGANFPDWESVLNALGAPVAKESGLHINSTSAVILAALSGRGVAIVRHALVNALIETGQLIQLHPLHRWPLSLVVLSRHAAEHGDASGSANLPRLVYRRRAGGKHRDVEKLFCKARVTD
ncbi:Gcv operon activator [Kluyvera cryocrescens]|uniref:Gcv operon activator n=1 Tax=Kluyvera cryocrescens TaxID=580 RepID=A0A485AKM3_KLUCR|nr:Gcv operon activator [Kluyvera cryocrescens]